MTSHVCVDGGLNFCWGRGSKAKQIYCYTILRAGIQMQILPRPRLKQDFMTYTFPARISSRCSQTYWSSKKHTIIIRHSSTMRHGANEERQRPEHHGGRRRRWKKQYG